MTAEETIAKLHAAQGDPRRLALATLDIVLSSHKPELRDVIEAAAIPHWFTKDILAQLLEIDDGLASEYMDQLQRFPMVERFSARDGWNVHEATRLALRSQWATEKSTTFSKLSARAAQCFAGNEPHQRIERLFHLFVAAPSEAESNISTLRKEWRGSEKLLTLGPLTLELGADKLLPEGTEFQIELVRLDQTLGDVARSFGQSQQARIYFERAEANAERLAQAEPNRADLQRDLSFSYSKLGDLARDLGQNESAEAYFQKAHAIAERLTQAEPNRADLQRDLAVSYDKLGDLARALAILEALKKDGRMLPTDEPILADLREQVQKAKGSSA